MARACASTVRSAWHHVNGSLAIMNAPISIDYSCALDYSGKTVLVVGGSSGIGNGIAQAFRELGAEVHVWGTRPGRDDYSADEGSDLSGLSYACVDLTNQAAIDAYDPPFDRLDVLVQ